MGWKEVPSHREKYLEKLRDPRWQKMRLRVFERDKFTCQFCRGTETTLNVHHLRYIKGREPWEYELSDLLTLCEDCHREDYEFRPRLEQRLIEFLRLAGWSGSQLDELTFGLWEVVGSGLNLSRVGAVLWALHTEDEIVGIEERYQAHLAKWLGPRNPGEAEAKPHDGHGG